MDDYHVQELKELMKGQETNSLVQSRDGYRNGCCGKNRFGGGFEFKFVFESRYEGCFEYELDCVYANSENAVAQV